jgi:hypothetical protein
MQGKVGKGLVRCIAGQASSSPRWPVMAPVAARPWLGRDRRGCDLFIGGKCSCQRPKRPTATSRSQRRPRGERTAGGGIERTDGPLGVRRPTGVRREEGARLRGGLGGRVDWGRGGLRMRPGGSNTEGWRAPTSGGASRRAARYSGALESGDVAAGLCSFGLACLN